MRPGRRPSALRKAASPVAGVQGNAWSVPIWQPSKAAWAATAAARQGLSGALCTLWFYLATDATKRLTQSTEITSPVTLTNQTNQANQPQQPLAPTSQPWLATKSTIPTNHANQPNQPWPTKLTNHGPDFGLRTRSLAGPLIPPILVTPVVNHAPTNQINQTNHSDQPINQANQPK